jgi:hypothetical protein
MHESILNEVLSDQNHSSLLRTNRSLPLIDRNAKQSFGNDFVEIIVKLDKVRDVGSNGFEFETTFT